MQGAGGGSHLSLQQRVFLKALALSAAIKSPGGAAGHEGLGRREKGDERKNCMARESEKLSGDKGIMRSEWVYASNNDFPFPTAPSAPVGQRTLPQLSQRRQPLTRSCSAAWPCTKPSAPSAALKKARTERRKPPWLSSVTSLPELPRLRGVISKCKCFPWTAALRLGTPPGEQLARFESREQRFRAAFGCLLLQVIFPRR